MTFKHLKRCSASVIKTMNYYFLSSRLAKIKNVIVPSVSEDMKIPAGS